MIFAILLIIAVVIGLIIRKNVLKKVDKQTAEFLKKRGTTLEKELQEYLDAQNKNVKIQKATPYYLFKYKNNEYTCIITKFKIKDENNIYMGIVSDSGSCTELKKYNMTSYIQEANQLLQKIYYQPNMKINNEYFSYLPKLDNIYDFNIKEDEKIIYNTIIKNLTTDKNISIGLNCRFTMTDKKIYINNGMGLFTIDIENDIADFNRENMCIEIMLSEILIFGPTGERIATGFKFYFNNESINKFEEIMKNILY